MTRIISGYLGSMQLKAAAKSTRPTSDRVKESLFAKLNSMGVIEGAQVLDLFAGTGALGIEAISRGAQGAIFVENNRQAHSLLVQNIDSARSSLEKQQLTAILRPENQEASRFLKNTPGLFDLVFIDPPYEVENSQIQELLNLLRSHISDQGVVVVERSSKNAAVTSDAYVQLSLKVYGDTAVSLLEPR